MVGDRGKQCESSMEYTGLGENDHPKHRFIVWLLMHNRLNTKARLFNLRIISEQICGICMNGPETVEHLFFGCSYSEQCINAFRQRMDWRSKGTTWIEVLKWIKNTKVSKLKKKIMYSFLATLIYHIWRVRNEVFWLEKLWTIENTVQKVIKEIQMRVQCMMPKKATLAEREWINSLCIKQ